MSISTVLLQKEISFVKSGTKDANNIIWGILILNKHMGGMCDKNHLAKSLISAPIKPIYTRLALYHYQANFGKESH